MRARVIAALLAGLLLVTGAAGAAASSSDVLFNGRAYNLCDALRPGTAQYARHGCG